MKPLLCLLLVSLPLLGQSVAGLGGITGTVSDATGARIPEVEVVVSNAERGINRRLTTNGSGIFSAGSLTPGPDYQVTISKAGFSRAEAKNLTVQVGQVIDLQFALTVSASATTVEVTTDAPAIDSAKTGVSQVVNEDQILNLPINGRRVDSFVLLTPGVTNDGTFGGITFRGVPGGGAFLQDGNDSTQQYYNENAGRTRIATNISQDTVQEFQVITGGSAEFGRASGGVINTVTKSGGNSVHGTAFWFFRNQNFNARDRYAAFRTDERRDQLGGSIGGPIRKDKLFYFFNTEITRRDFPLLSSNINQPLFNSNGAYIAACTATPAQCDNARRFIDRFNLVVPRTANQELLFGKFDYRLNDRHTLTASFNYLRWISPNGIQTAAVLNNGGAIGNNGLSTVRTRNGRLSLTSLPTNTMVNEFRFGWFKDRLADDVNPAYLPYTGFDATLTVNGVTNLGSANILPRVQPTEDRFQFVDNLSVTVGKHLIKFGADLAQTRDVQNQILNIRGTYVYANVTAFAQDLTDNSTGAKRWQSYSQSFGNPLSTIWIRDFNFFAQDQYRVTNRLSLNYGLRYELATFTQPTQAVPNYPRTGLIPEPKKNFAPRFGVAYTLIPNKTVLRGSWGMFYARTPGALVTNLNTLNIQQVSYNLQSNNAASLAAGPVFPNRLTTPPSVAAGARSITYAGENFRTPYTMQGDLGIEQAITPNTSLTVSWAFNRGVRMLVIRDANVGPLGPEVTYRINDAAGNQAGTYTTPVYRLANRVDTAFQRVNVIEGAGNLWYNGLLVQFQNRKMNFGPLRTSGNISYTWAHSIDENVGNGGNVFFSGGPTSFYNGNYRNEKGSSGLDQRHRLVVAQTLAYRPFGKPSAFNKYVVNDWQLSLLGTFASSFAFTPNVNGAGIVIPGAPAAFTASLNGLAGDNRVPFLPRNFLDIDQARRLDTRLSKLFKITERYVATFNFEAFNVFNTPMDTARRSQLYNVTNGTTLTPIANYGEGTASAGFPDGTNVRRLQLSLRFTF
ncbi:MAG: TonB-dependent receptor [Bryobacteraceae bacterium]|nr:TonB-dependent receptor [Bryobacteraceae bacterium]